VKFNLVEFSIKRPTLVIIIILLVTAAFATQFPKITTDTDPNNMLPETSDVRVTNREVEQTFGLHKDMIALGIVNERGVFNSQTVARLAKFTGKISKLDGVASKDVMNFLSASNITLSSAEPPESEVSGIKGMVMGNPILVGRFVSGDEKTTAIFVPLEDGANGKAVADQIWEISDSDRGDETYLVAGDPVARDTFGSEMFLQMGLFSPIAGFIMMLVLYLMFRNWPLTLSIMGVAMISIIWTLGLLIGLGYPVHIMSSMIPVFLMAISTAGIHVFNEFYFCCGELEERRRAIMKTMKAVGAPIWYTALAAAVGFAVLGIGNIIPVRVFGLSVAFGIAAVALLSFTFLPAVMALVSEKSLRKASSREDMTENWVSGLLNRLGTLVIRRRGIILVAGIIIVGFSIWGITRIRVNNNMVTWFKSGSDIRVADRVINENLGGTNMGYLVAQGNGTNSLATPVALNYIEGLQRQVETLGTVGKTYSVVDMMKMMNMMMSGNNQANFVVPNSQEAITGFLSSSARPSDINSSADKANIQVQLKTWDASAMDEVLNKVDNYTAMNPAPAGIIFQPAGIAYFNKIWNDEVLGDMVKVFIIGTIVIFFVLLIIYRSLKWAIVSFIPLLFTIIIIFGAIGFMGKDFDMPISVLSTLSLGLAVDFAIHFVRRYRQRLADDPDIDSALVWTIVRPGKGIIRNAILFSAAFSVMIFAALTPYITVGVFIMSIMGVSAVLTIAYLPALISLFRLR
jgi:predicted RND superfamily exporter protein